MPDLTQFDTKCGVSPTGRHQPQYDNGALVTMDVKRLRAECQWCGAELKRAHHRSAWWHAGSEA